MTALITWYISNITLKSILHFSSLQVITEAAKILQSDETSSDFTECRIPFRLFASYEVCISMGLKVCSRKSHLKLKNPVSILNLNS